jgi:hypothetical protein
LKTFFLFFVTKLKKPPTLFYLENTTGNVVC